MRSSRRFAALAFALESLEARVVLSHVAPVVGHPLAAEVQTGTASVPGAPAPGASQAGLGMDMSAATQAGYTVYQQRTTHYSDGTTQIDDRLTVPNPNQNGTTTTDWISLRNGSGVEKMVTVATKAGNVITDNMTTTLPNGSVRTSVRTFTSEGRQTAINDTINPPTGGVETVTGTKTQRGHTQVVSQSINESDGVHQSHSVIINPNQYHQIETTTTTNPQGVSQTLKENTTIERLAPPSS